MLRSVPLTLSLRGPLVFHTIPSQRRSCWSNCEGPNQRRKRISERPRSESIKGEATYYGNGKASEKTYERRFTGRGQESA